MSLLQDFLDLSKHLNQASLDPHKVLRYHPPNQRFKSVVIGLKLPGLPAPLHYFQFVTVLGLPNSALLHNQSAIQTTALDTATVCSSISLHMVGQLNCYSIAQECQFEFDKLQFGHQHAISGNLPHLKLSRTDPELSFDIDVQTFRQIIYFAKLRLGLAEHWSLPALCQGSVTYKNQKYQIEGLASFEFAKMVNFPYMPFAFYIYQIVNFNADQQMILMQYRDAFNRILYSRIYIRNLHSGGIQFFDDRVQLSIDRVYPVVQTPNGDSMYVLREFTWCYCDETYQIQLQGKCRGDFKFGFGTGFMGSFCYQLVINAQYYEGEGGYCEYIDCRALKWQEQNQTETLLTDLENSVPLMLKK
ncbi:MULTISPECIES: DUF6670 family protein [unclassified Acinetobacter]|uniref:DUF6670 family protein n=1 Tax=unclassified Acinetobacter TaxID=196816 RepID=UPI00293440B5|nr:MULTISPECIES: DUF6670 family protein [unclassified Acinetobacter]WOE31319.1 hypothetical protein QSG84_13455 [Acinetobacter sp. SAAs470]WOE39515.1 hypothetical protein QSG86_07120 [Acinetobacter sp. SAAs474]